MIRKEIAKYSSDTAFAISKN